MTTDKYIEEAVAGMAKALLVPEPKPKKRGRPRKFQINVSMTPITKIAENYLRCSLLGLAKELRREVAENLDDALVELFTCRKDYGRLKAHLCDDAQCITAQELHHRFAILSSEDKEKE